MSHPWVRIDDRLIHGQVTVAWRQHLCCDEIWVVDDALAVDPFLQDALRLATPPDVVLHVYTIEEATSAWEGNDAPGPPAGNSSTAPREVLVLLKSPQAALALVERGVPLAQLNVGNLAARPGSRRALKSISLTGEQIAALDHLAERGIAILFQPVPEEPPLEWCSLRRRLQP